MESKGKEPGSEFLLECQGLTKTFGSLIAVNNLSFNVRTGQVLGIGGPNGAGKTALFDTISGVNPCTNGKIIFGGERIDRLSPDDICHRGLARTFQLNAGFDSLSVVENMQVCSYFGRAKRTIPGIAFDKYSKERVSETIELVGLQDFEKTTVKNLPVFQRKLLMIGSALVTDPKLLLLDEPVGGLIPTEIDAILRLIEQITKWNVTIILIEHVMRFLMQLSDKVLILNRGDMLFEGSPTDILNDKKVVEVYLGERTAKSLRKQIG